MEKMITGAMLRKMVVSGANYLEENKEYVNALNVFPVPDGDTGTNMSLTMKSAVKEINMCRTKKNIDLQKYIVLQIKNYKFEEVK